MERRSGGDKDGEREKPERKREGSEGRPGTEERRTTNEFPSEKEGHGEITEQKEKTEMTFLKGLLCGVCRKKNEM